jgi:hypothetical protein
LILSLFKLKKENKKVFLNFKKPNYLIKRKNLVCKFEIEERLSFIDETNAVSLKNHVVFETYKNVVSIHAKLLTKFE